MDSAFILNRRPFRDNSLLVDLFTKESGRITCVARVAKKRGKIMTGTLEPFRLLRVEWIGKGEVQTLTLAEEQGRYRIPVTDLCKALYLNELLLKLVPKFAPSEDAFVGYQWAIRQLTEQTCSLADCEIGLLASMGFSFCYTTDHQTHSAIQTHLSYRYFLDDGLLLDTSPSENRYAPRAEQGVAISGKLLIKLNERCTLDIEEQQQLRHFLNQFIDILLAGKKLNSRKLAFGY